MAVNDVWRNISKEIGVYSRGQFGDVPIAPGVYAWFYPLRVTTKDLDDLTKELQAVFLFDAKTGGPPRQSAEVQFAWRFLELNVIEQFVTPNFGATLIEEWKGIVSESERFSAFRRALMRASILMPPLYVGRTKCLQSRCSQHIAGTGKGDFHRRYTDYAQRAALPSREVADLLFASIRTDIDLTGSKREADTSVLEEILKYAARPAYGIR